MFLVRSDESSAVIAAADPSLHFSPGLPRRPTVKQVGLSSGQLRELPVVNGNGLGSGGKVIPKVLDKLQFLCRAQVKHRPSVQRHGSSPVETTRYVVTSCSLMATQPRFVVFVVLEMRPAKTFFALNSLHMPPGWTENCHRATG